MKLKSIALAAGLAMSALSLSAQFQNPNIENFGPPTEKYLGAPNPSEGTQLIPVGTDLYSGNDDNTIHYGLTPPNSGNKPVMVFVHGYASNASVFYTGRDNMYHDAYQDGYRTAFVSLTPNKHVWTNGAMLSTSIDRIAQHYGVSDVVVVGWSKGGVDTDAAVAHFGANAKVSEVFTLSTPHHGTALAELANSWLLSLVNIIFMQNNDATKSLTRGYMGYFRSLTDNAPGNTVAYTTLGGWGNGPLNRLDIPQGLLHASGGSKASGGNDGVVPYVSSLRPGGNELFDGQRKAYGWFGIPYYPGPSETNLDHFEVTRGDHVWPFIKGTLNGTLRTAGQQTASNFTPNSVISSRQQLLTNAPGANTFVIEPGAESVSLELPGGVDTPFSIRDAAGNQVALPVQSTEDVLAFSLTGVLPGTYTLEAPIPVVALVAVENGPLARLNTGLAAGETVVGEASAMQFTFDFDEMEGAIPADMQVTGILHRTSDLHLQAVEAAPLFLEFRREGGRFVAEVSADVAAGIYGLTVNARSQTLARTVVTSLAKLGSEAANVAAPAPQIAIAEAFPNPFSGVLNLSLNLGEDFTGALNIYNVYGQAVKTVNFAGASGLQNLTWQAEGLAAGIYIVELRSDSEKVIRKVVLE